MLWSTSIPLLVVAGADYALGSRNHHIHHHGHKKPHVEVAPRDQGLIDTNPAQLDMLVEFRTTTTTVFEECIPTNTRYVTTTVFEDYSEPTALSMPAVLEQSPSHTPSPKPAPVKSVLEPATATIQSTELKPTVVQKSPEPSLTTVMQAPDFSHTFARPTHSEAAESPSPSHFPNTYARPTDSKNAETHSLLAQPFSKTALETSHFPNTFMHPTHSKPVVPQSPTDKPAVTTTTEQSSNTLNTFSRPTNAEIEKPQQTTEEQTTTIHMTKTVTAEETEAASVSTTSVSTTSTTTETSASSIHSSSITSAAPYPSTTLAEEQLLSPATTKIDPATEPHLLPTLPSLPNILPTNPTEIIPHLPVPGLDEVLHPQGTPTPSNLDWTALPANNAFTFEGFGGRSKPAGTGIKYHGNVGVPWGSNIIAVSPTEAHRYKYVARFTGSNSQPWTVIIWNKIGPDGKMDGWYSHSALTFVLAPGETRYVAFDEDSVGAWSAAPGTNGLPTDRWGGYTSTWGEFSFGDIENNGWSGWDVSAIQAQVAKQKVQGMKICQADGQGCSAITPDAKKVVNAYTESKKHHDGIGGAASPGPVRLAVELDYTE
ncbi:hypothetical protein N7532_003732 [Penicillium argentinense]|uniref:Allergen Asp f 4 n=1 Tax=Penicillium argentinense TaxID=1131581 RepID=A0A9W9FN67_9EURO|nr:uncharacterized protein N7532_003732 [Penicillium argentinense]KAJ5103203.1 hypothetical protein N7532_003732 [Penicillium argentinense]